MTRSRIFVSCVLLTLMGWAGGSAFAQTAATVRTVNRVPVLSRPTADANVVVTLDKDVVVDVLDHDGQWFWVSLPPDAAGARSRGWVHAADVQSMAAGDGTADAPAARRVSSAIPPTGDEIRRAQAQRDQDARERAQAEAKIEQARQHLEEQRRKYEAIAHPGVTPEAAATAVPPARRPVQLSDRPSYDVFGGYSLLFDTSDSVTFPLGWIGSVSGSLTDTVSIVAEVSGSYKSANVLGVTQAGENIHTFTAGPRFSRRSGGIAAYGQMLAGFEVASANAFGYSASSTGLALVPGFGVDIPVAPSLGVRIGGEFGIVRDSGAWFNGFRITTGLVVTGRR
jgi:hypothetical protein